MQQVHAGKGSLLDAGPEAAGLAGSLVATQAVFSVTVEGDLLADSDGAPASAEPLTDWRLVVAPALVLENLLPIRGTFLVWEKPQACPSYLNSPQPACSMQHSALHTCTHERVSCVSVTDHDVPLGKTLSRPSCSLASRYSRLQVLASWLLRPPVQGWRWPTLALAPHQHTQLPACHTSAGVPHHLSRLPHASAAQLTGQCWQQGSRNLVLRQSGQVESGAQARIYAAGVQNPVSLQFYPDGYDWAEAEPIALWHGTRSDQVQPSGCFQSLFICSMAVWHGGSPQHAWGASTLAVTVGPAGCCPTCLHRSFATVYRAVHAGWWSGWR